MKKMGIRESGRTSFTFPGEPLIRLKKLIKVKKVIATFHLSWACCNCLAWYGSCVGPLPFEEIHISGAEGAAPKKSTLVVPKAPGRKNQQ